jgi:drug/metabolite transporter (DMT)-like permease
MQGSRRTATAFAIGSILLWCWSGVCFASGSRLIGPAAYLSFMTATGAVTIVVLQVFRRRPLSGLVRLPLKVIVSGFFGVALYTVMLAMAFGMAAESDLGQINLLNYLWPIWIVLLSILLLEDHPGGPTVIGGALMGFTGVALSKGIEGLLRPPVDWRPHLMALIGGFLWASYCVLLRRWRIPEEKGGTAFHFALCAILAALMASWRGEWQGLTGWSPEAVLWVIFGGVGPVGLAYHWWEIGMKRGNLNLLVPLAYFIPVGSSLLIALIFEESMNRGLIPGALLITAGAWLAGRGKPDS